MLVCANHVAGGNGDQSVGEAVRSRRCVLLFATPQIVLKSREIGVDPPSLFWSQTSREPVQISGTCERHRVRQRGERDFLQHSSHNLRGDGIGTVVQDRDNRPAASGTERDRIGTETFGNKDCSRHRAFLIMSSGGFACMGRYLAVVLLRRHSVRPC